MQLVAGRRRWRDGFEESHNVRDGQGPKGALYHCSKTPPHTQLTAETRTIAKPAVCPIPSFSMVIRLRE